SLDGFSSSNFKYLHMDGIDVLPSDNTFTVRNGSIIIQMNPRYLNTLSLGSHAITIGLQGGSYEGALVTTTITVTNRTSVVPPKTGDNTPLLLLRLALVVSCIGLAAALVAKKRGQKV
ncbi:MAG: hypothetical protein RR068_19805, partial [Hafnia sp.]